VSEVTALADAEERDTDELEQVAFDETLIEQVDPEVMADVRRLPGFFKKLFSKTQAVTQLEPAVASPPAANPTFLVQKFRAFYNEVVVYKNQKAEFSGGYATAILADFATDLSPEQSAQSLSVRLQQLLELQSAESSWMGGEAAALYPQAQYAMAVLADEILSHAEWPGQVSWGQHRLELAVFKTAAADVEFFRRVDGLLKNGPQATATRDLARVYFLVIASGFRGKYRPFGLVRPLAEYRLRLYEFVYGGDALLLYGDDRRLFPEALSVTMAGKGLRRFSMAQQWVAILILMLTGYTVISNITWKRVSADLKDIAARVEQARRATPAVDSPNGGGR
jgi:type IV/VI secretion system ImpK/VasF family protein